MTLCNLFLCPGILHQACHDLVQSVLVSWHDGDVHHARVLHHHGHLQLIFDLHHVQEVLQGCGTVTLYLQLVPQGNRNMRRQPCTWRLNSLCMNNLSLPHPPVTMPAAVCEDVHHLSNTHPCHTLHCGG